MIWYTYSPDQKLHAGQFENSVIHIINEETESQLFFIPISEIPPSTTREISVYNIGDPNQTDETPCIGASGDNLCDLVSQGKLICAANFVPLHTTLHIENIGECLVLDRMNAKFPDRVDLALPLDKIEEAKQFGVKNLQVTIL